MNKTIVCTESYLIRGGQDKRFYPFLELEYDEWIIYEDDFPKYYINLSLDSTSNSSFEKWLISQLKSGEKLQNLVISLGKQYGKKWSIFSSQLGMEVEGSHKSEKLELEILDDKIFNVGK